MDTVPVATLVVLRAIWSSIDDNSLHDALVDESVWDVPAPTFVARNWKAFAPPPQRAAAATSSKPKLKRNDRIRFKMVGTAPVRIVVDSWTTGSVAASLVTTAIFLMLGSPTSSCLASWMKAPEPATLLKLCRGTEIRRKTRVLNNSVFFARSETAVSDGAAWKSCTKQFRGSTMIGDVFDKFAMGIAMVKKAKTTMYISMVRINPSTGRVVETEHALIQQIAATARQKRCDLIIVFVNDRKPEIARYLGYGFSIDSRFGGATTTRLIRPF